LPIIFVNFINAKQVIMRYMQQNFASFGLLSFARWWSNAFKVWWDTWHGFCCKFHGEYDNERYWISVNIC